MKNKIKLPDGFGNDFMIEATSRLASDIHEKRNKIIIDRLKAVAGIDFDIKSEANRRFKSLAVEYRGNKEVIYYNDGSEQGMRIVTFVRKDNPMTFKTDRCEISMEYSYY